MGRRVEVAIAGAVLCIACLGTGVAVFSDGAVHRPSPLGSPSAGTDAAAACQVDGLRTVTVPNAVGRPLRDAVALARAAGLRVVDDGVAPGDPTGPSATVQAEEPPGGVQVPAGACIGFRTKL